MRELFKDPMSNPSILDFHIPCKLSASVVSELDSLVGKKKGVEYERFSSSFRVKSFIFWRSQQQLATQKFWKYSSVALLFAFFLKGIDEIPLEPSPFRQQAEQNTYPSQSSLANYLSNFLKGNLIDALSKTTFPRSFLYVFRYKKNF